MNNEQLQKELRDLYKRTIDPIDPDRQYIDFLVEKSMEYMDEYTNKKVIEELWYLHEYMGQFPDDLNLAVMYERIKLIEKETIFATWWKWY